MQMECFPRHLLLACLPLVPALLMKNSYPAYVGIRKFTVEEKTVIRNAFKEDLGMCLCVCTIWIEIVTASVNVRKEKKR